MRVRCVDGYYMFYKDYTYDVIKLKQAFGLEVVPFEDYYTFKALAEMPDHTKKGYTLGSGIAKENYSGKPWELLRENQLAYNLELKNIVENFVNTGVYSVPYDNGGYYPFKVIPQVGFFLNGNNRIKGFNAFIDFDLNIVKVGEVW